MTTAAPARRLVSRRSMAVARQPVPAAALHHALGSALSRLEGELRPDGSVAGETVWCCMITAQVAIVHAVTGLPLSPERRMGILRYLDHEQLADGGFPLYPGGGSTVFLTTLAYVAQRLLGREADHPSSARARSWLKVQEVAAIPTWGKAWLAMAGLYEWEGLNPIPPEIWLLPKAAPMHPRRFYCHTRLIYLGFSYLYGVRYVGALNPALRDALRRELYGDYDAVDFVRFRSEVAATDRYVPKVPALEASYAALAAAEPHVPRQLRRRALSVVLERLRAEHRSSQFLGISPVNGLLFTVALHHASLVAKPGQREDLTEEARLSWAGVDHWAWDDEEGGRRYAGAASNTWDTAFAAQALLELEGPLARSAAPLLRRMHHFFQTNQITDELSEAQRWDRVAIRHGWCFGEGQHRWPVSDCTAEALSALTQVEEQGLVARRFDAERIAGAVAFVLQRQNADGGFSSYEPARGGRLLERINPSEMFGSCMGEYSYLECTSSCIQGLVHTLTSHGASLPPELARGAARAVARGADYLARCAGPNGAFEAVWGVNFTYGALFAITGLRAAGRPPHDPAVVSAVDWLLSHRLSDGGWGEEVSSCWTHCYTPSAESQVVMTAWAMLALVRSGRRDSAVLDAVRGGAALLLVRQQGDGGWPREGVAGVFFDTAGLHYELYRLVFPLWALAAATKAGCLP